MAVIAAGVLEVLFAGAAPANAQAPDCPPGWVCRPGPDEERSPSTREEELEMRIEQLERSMGFGGLFGPALENWLNSSSTPPAGAEAACAAYTDDAAREACRAGDLWAADRLQADRASPQERDWYNR